MTHDVIAFSRALRPALVSAQASWPETSATSHPLRHAGSAIALTVALRYLASRAERARRGTNGTVDRDGD